MANLVHWIEEAAESESIEAVVIGEMGWGKYKSETVPGYVDHPRGKVLSWAEARPLLNYNFNDGYGAPGCEAIYVWTTMKVMFISQYDGSVSLNWIPRNPIDVMPSMPGG